MVVMVAEVVVVDFVGVVVMVVHFRVFLVF